MIQETDIRQRLAAYLQQKLALIDFEDWLVSQSWNMHQDSSAEAQDLVATIELALAEHSNGHLSEAQLRSQLLDALDRIFADVQISSDFSVRAKPRAVITANSAGAPPSLSLPAPA